MNPDPESNFPKPDISADKAWENMAGLLDTKIPVSPGNKAAGTKSSPSSAGGSVGGVLGGSSQIMGIILAASVTAGGLIWGVSSLKNKPDSTTEIANITETFTWNIVTDSSNSIHQIASQLTNEKGSSEASDKEVLDDRYIPGTVQKEKSPSEKGISQGKALDISAFLSQDVAWKAQAENLAGERKEEAINHFPVDGSVGLPELPDKGENPPEGENPQAGKAPPESENPQADETSKQANAPPADETPQVVENLHTDENQSLEEDPLTDEGSPTSEEQPTILPDSQTNKKQRKSKELKTNLSWYAGFSGSLGECIQKERESTKYYGAMISSGVWHNKLGAGIETGIGLERHRDYSSVIENLRIPNQDSIYSDSLGYLPYLDTTQISEYKYLYHYVQIPLFISKQVWSNGKFSFTVKTGPLLGILFLQKNQFENTIGSVYGKPVGNFDSDYSRLNLSWQWHTLFQFGWNINDHFSLTISPHSVFYLNELNENEIVPGYKPLGIGVKGGLIYSF